MKIPKWQDELARYYKQGKLVSYFLNNASKTCLYGLNIQRTLKLDIFLSLEHFFISVAIFTQVASAPLINCTMQSSNLFWCIQLFPAFFIVQDFQSPHIFQGSGVSGSRFYKARVQGLGPGFTSSHILFTLTWINFLLIKHKLIKLNFLCNLKLVHCMLINYPNLIKESIQKKLLSIIL